MAKSFARIHHANLINFGIVPLIFSNPADYDKIEQGDRLQIDLTGLEEGKVIMKNLSNGEEIVLKHNLSEREIVMLRKGGKLAYIRDKNKR